MGDSKGLEMMATIRSVIQWWLIAKKLGKGQDIKNFLSSADGEDP